jgi:hypothetical protein
VRERVRERLANLARGLAEKTAKGEVTWERAGEADFLCVVGDRSVVVQSIDGDGAPPLRMAVRDEHGVEVVSLDWNVTRTTAGTLAEDPRNDDLVQLYEAARFAASEVDKVLTELFDELGIRE